MDMLKVGVRMRPTVLNRLRAVFVPCEVVGVLDEGRPATAAAHKPVATQAISFA